MVSLAASSGCGLIAMRSRLEGGRFVMPPYGEAGERTAIRALEELDEVHARLENAGIAESRVALDPGFGFGTTFTEDLAMWNALSTIPHRLCVGVSRKRFTAWNAGKPDLPAAERDGLTAALHTEAAASGIRIFRSHAATLQG
jgi:dihydropteroate synthase